MSDNEAPNTPASDPSNPGQPGGDTAPQQSSDTDAWPALAAAGSVEHGELVAPTGEAVQADGMITSPAKVMRIGSMVKQLLEEVRQTPLDDASRERLGEVYDRSVVELSEALSPDLQEELRLLHLPFEDGTAATDAELRIAQAQLVGWLEGLFHGIQATLFAQQLAARQQLEQMRQMPAPPGAGQGPAGEDRSGTYL